jgi:hypothetical protein
MVLARFPNGLGSVRAIDSTWVAGGQGFGESEPEHTALITDVFPGMAAVQPMPGVNTIRPWDPAVTPYVYSPWFGTTYQATLGAAITDTGSTDAQGRLVSTITINDAATAPIMYGQMLQVDSEYMSVLSVSGTSVTVRRGSRASTPATHSTGVGTLGSITVMYRIAANLSKFGNNILFMELVFASPHTAITGPLYGFSVTATWPDPVDAIKGLTTPFYLNNGTKTLMVTGPSTALIFAPYDGNSGSAATTCNQTYTLNPAVNFIRRNTVGGNSYTVEAIPAVSNALNANPHISIPIGANDDMVDSIARRVRDIITPGKTVWLEMGDEPWNWAAAWWHMANHSQAMSRLLHGPTASQLAYYADRVDQIRQRFEDRFNEGGRNRGGEIRSILNQSVGGRPDMMTHAGNMGHKVGAVAVAPYINTHKNIANGTAFLGATDAEMVDLAIIDNWHGKFGLWTGLAGHRRHAGRVQLDVRQVGRPLLLRSGRRAHLSAAAQHGQFRVHDRGGRVRVRHDHHAVRRAGCLRHHRLIPAPGERHADREQHGPDAERRRMGPRHGRVSGDVLTVDPGTVRARPPRPDPGRSTPGRGGSRSSGT